MTPEAIMALIIGFVVLFLLIFVGVPIVWSLMVSGIVGFAIVTGIDKSLTVLNYTAWSVSVKEMLVCLPLFITMGMIAFESGLTTKLFALASSFVGRLKGGMAMAISIACGLFGALSGSVIAALGTFGPVAIPELDKYRYNKNFSAVVLAASATFASMIPPSILFIMYGYITETSISKLFMAGIFPGVITVVVYCGIIYFMVKRNPSLAPETPPKVNWGQRGRLVLSNIPLVCIALVVLGGIYLGWFTPTESAGIGLFLILVLVIATRRIGLKGLGKSFLSSGRTTAMIVFLLIGGTCLTAFVAVTGVAAAASDFIAGLGLNSYVLIAAIFVLYIIWGCFIGDMSMLVLVLPVVFPIAEAAGISAIWFGVFTIKGLEIASVTPPVGINVFIMEGLAKDRDVRSSAIFRFVTPFVIADTLVLALITAFPQICLWLPSTMS
jgi:C4-dicarboxylate transporter DctM subunit